MAPDGPRLSRASQAARIAQRTPRIGKTITFLHSRGPGWQGARSGLHDGKVTGNLRFGDWYSNTGSGITADGKQIAPLGDRGSRQQQDLARQELRSAAGLIRPRRTGAPGDPQRVVNAPPLTWMVCPVMCLAPGDARKYAVSAMSSGRPGRLSWVAAISASRRWLVSRWRKKLVSAI